ncbi:flagellar protein FlaG [Shewanella avicenniae]|uniref:Flagellar protein FlaG n=2 Tax=Shewanella avicenniae TaxID=2814294 RepID=A0ABX7QX17_9GAMM|nr:flagellar protein FlaG [Shewanella avicenniae]
MQPMVSSAAAANKPVAADVAPNGVAAKSVQPINAGANIAANPEITQAVNNAESANSQDAQAELSQVALDLTETMSMMKKGLEFKVAEQDGQPVVSVVDVDSGDVIRQIPSEEALKLAEKMSEVAGLLMKTEA